MYWKKFGIGMFALSVAMLSLAGPANAAVISWNVDNNGTVGGDGAGSLPDLSSEAGVVQVGGWTNDFPAYDPNNLRDNMGNATTLDIVPASTNGTWAIDFAHPGQDADGSWNLEMINGYLNAGGGGTSSVALAEIPYAQYDIIVYFSSDVANREGNVTDGTTTYYFSAIGQPSTDGPNAILAQAMATSPTDPGDGDAGDGDDPLANYAVFSGLSGASQTITVDIPNFGGLAGFQVVEIPEPASLALFGFTGLMLVFPRSRSHFAN